MKKSLSLTSVQTAITAAVVQIIAVAVALGAFSTTQEQIIVTAAGSVIAAVFAVIQAVESYGKSKIAAAKIAAGGK